MGITSPLRLLGGRVVHFNRPSDRHRTKATGKANLLPGSLYNRPPLQCNVCRVTEQGLAFDIHADVNALFFAL